MSFHGFIYNELYVSSFVLALWSCITLINVYCNKELINNNENDMCTATT